MIEVLGVLPQGIDAPIVVAIHAGELSRLTEVLQMKIALPVRTATEGQRLERGVVSVCPGGEHTRIEGDILRLNGNSTTPRFRPSVDILFTSAAASYGPGTIAVVLSGNLNDGSAGAEAVYRAGGVMLVQTPREAAYPSMPESIVMNDHPDDILDAQDIAVRLAQIVGDRGLARLG